MSAAMRFCRERIHRHGAINDEQNRCDALAQAAARSLITASSGDSVLFPDSTNNQIPDSRRCNMNGKRVSATQILMAQDMNMPTDADVTEVVSRFVTLAEGVV